MSEDSSQLSDALSDTRLEQTLRDTVRKIYENGDLEELTVKRVRGTVERELSLGDGFFKQGEWKDRSKSIIEEEAIRHGDASESSTKSSSPVKSKTSKRTAKSSAAKNKATEKKRKAADNTNGKDEQEGGQSSKKQRKSRLVVSDDEDDEEDYTTSKPSPPIPTKSNDIKETHSDERQSTPNAESIEPQSNINNRAEAEEVDELRDSDLSEVLDEAPAPKRKKKAHAKKPESNGKKQTKAAKPKTMDADAEEIKSLQGWLVKCGIRKVWGKELKPYETSKEKIKHLKQMLADVGMSGRYSKEKAASIREARELAADLEAVQEGAKLWGKEKDADTSGSRRSARATVPTIDFGDSDSED